MKNYVLLTGFLLLMLPAAFSQDMYTPLKADEISQEKLQSLSRLVGKIMDGQKSGDYYPLSEYEATAEMLNAFTADVQKQSYQSLQNLFGDYQSFEFSEAMRYRSYIIYRFSATFSKNDERVELRAVTDEAGKLGGFWVKPWKDDLNSSM